MTLNSKNKNTYKWIKFDHKKLTHAVQYAFPAYQQMQCCNISHFVMLLLHYIGIYTPLVERSINTTLQVALPPWEIGSSQGSLETAPHIYAVLPTFCKW